VTTLQQWAAGARPRTLPAALVPVAVGTAAADPDGGLVWWRVGAALIVSLCLQVGVNYANDYSDGVRGTDDVRVGPLRLVASGTASARAVKMAALLFFAAAAVAGLALALAVSLWLVAVGAAAILAAWTYTGGPKPYGYLGFGELFVFVFFGLVATAGTAYVQDESLTLLGVMSSVPVGLAAVALLVTNNLRDLPRDREAGKKTLAVRMGDRPTRVVYTGIVAGVFLVMPYLALARPGALLGLLAVPFAVPPVRAVLSGASGGELIPVLGATGRLQLAMGLTLTVGLALGG
jgi:1,4-dihydroxy-2-naphthoate octaprenyltransferase